MAPLRNAMGFIDGDQRDFRALHHLAKPIRQGAFGRDIEQIKLAIDKIAPHLAAIG